MTTRSGKNYSSPPSIKNSTKFKQAKRQCTICLDTKILRKFVQPVHECKESKICCKTCFGRYVETKLMTTGFPISCMFDQCQTDLGFMEIYNCLPDSRMRGLLQKSSLDRHLASQSDFRHCPRPNCTGGSFGIGPDDIRAECNVCNLPFCIPCQDVDHPNQSCEEAKQNLFKQKPEEQQTQTLLETETKRCPNCTTPIAKSIGCDHICCTSCGFNFCWICMKQYVSGHFREHQSPQNNRTLNIEHLVLENGQEATRVTVTPRIHGRYFLADQQRVITVNEERLSAFREVAKLANDRLALLKQLKDLGVEPNIEAQPVPNNIAVPIQERFSFNNVVPK